MAEATPEQREHPKFKKLVGLDASFNEVGTIVAHELVGQDLVVHEISRPGVYSRTRRWTRDQRMLGWILAILVTNVVAAIVLGLVTAASTPTGF